jgi:Tfp pilus assembly protein PilX
MKRSRARGATLVVGLILLSLVTLLGLAGASAAHIEQRLAQNEQFRENAATAASAGIEIAISRIVTSPTPAAAPTLLRESMPEASDRFEVSIRFAGFETALPQEPGGDLVGAHFEIASTGFGASRAVDRQRASVMRVVRSADAAPLPCGPDAAGRHCYAVGEIARLSWQRVTVE